jgi:PAS domain S-box-containing protein
MPERVIEPNRVLEQSTDKPEKHLPLQHVIGHAGEELFQTAFRQTSTCTAITSPDGSFIAVNPAFCRLLGYSDDELMKLTMEEITHPDDREMVRHLRGEAQAGTRPSYVVGKRCFRKDGAMIWGELSGNWIYDSGRNPLYAVEVIQDTTAHKRVKENIEILHTNLASHAVELEAANRELEAFNYMVSHDLRSPVTRISGFCEILLGLKDNHVSEQSATIIRHIHEAGQHMNQLIESLLSFSSLSRCDMTVKHVDLTLLAQAVAVLLKASEPHRQVKFVIAAGVTGRGDVKLLRRVLENLLGNAWKYTGRQQTALIEFGVFEINGTPAYFVRDNGPGFDMAQADRLFAPFHRLHSQEEFAGHGIGLSTVKRIIQRHGGQTWAEAAPGKGATFFFSLA